MFKAIKNYLKSLQKHNVSIIEVNEKSRLVFFSENGAVIRASFDKLWRFSYLLAWMSNMDIARFAYLRAKYESIQSDIPRLDNDAVSNTICLEAEGRAGQVVCFDLALMIKKEYPVKQLMSDTQLLNRFTQLGAYRVGLLDGEMAALGIEPKGHQQPDFRIRAVG